jgi:uncharacterized membrane protein/nitrite reductase/ring-hydroxylating ferredoxin subunit
MRSRAHIKSHPLHPILVSFPIAFFTGALFFDVLALVREDGSFGLMACHLLIAGITMALVAAIPGIIDYLYTVPPKSSAKKRASTHAFLNLCMIALFAIALIYRTTDDHPSAVVLIFLEGPGFILLNVAGWMGGTLVHRNQIGVDPRYAFAGKWREEHLSSQGGKVRLGSLGNLKRDQMMLVHADGKRIAIARTETGYVAFDDRCTHKGGSLAGGMMMCETVQCPWHGSQFDVNHGGVKAGPAKEKIHTYPIESSNDILYLVLNPQV